MGGLALYRVTPLVLWEEGFDTVGALDDARWHGDPVPPDVRVVRARLAEATRHVLARVSDHDRAGLDVADAADDAEEARAPGATWLLEARRRLRRAIEDGRLPDAERGVVERPRQRRYGHVRDLLRLALPEVERLAAKLDPCGVDRLVDDGRAALAALDAADRAVIGARDRVAAAEAALDEAVAGLTACLKALDDQGEAVGLVLGAVPRWGIRHVLRRVVRAAAGRRRARRSRATVDA